MSLDFKKIDTRVSVLNFKSFPQSLFLVDLWMTSLLRKKQKKNLNSMKEGIIALSGHDPI